MCGDKQLLKRHLGFSSRTEIRSKEAWCAKGDGWGVGKDR